MTNFERIKAMSVEEMAMMLADEIPHGDCYNCYLMEHCFVVDESRLDSSCGNAFLAWLESEVQDG